MRLARHHAFLSPIVANLAPWILARQLVLILAAAITPHALGAQGSVAGQLTLVERPGVRTPDLANAVVWMEPAGGGARNLSSAGTEIQMSSRTFVPKVRVVAVGSTVEFPNQDPFRHNVFSKSGASEFDLGLYGRGERRGARFDRAGVYPIFCNIHARMVAFVVAVATPYLAQPGSDGRFTIAGVPAGRYVMHVWHDRGGTTQREIEVGAGGVGAGSMGAGSVGPLALQLDARSYRYVPHKNKFGQEYPPTDRDRY